MNNFFKKPLDKPLFVWYIITMKATKKDFEFTAALINAARNGTPAAVLATLAAAQFAEGNPRFDVDRFKRACGLTWGEIESPTVACVSDTGTVAWSE